MNLHEYAKELKEKSENKRLIDEEIAKTRQKQWDESRRNSAINHPSHYRGVNGLEVFEVMDNFLPKYENAIDGYLVGNILKYVLRAPSKGKMNEDLRKAEKHLKMLIKRTSDESDPYDKAIYDILAELPKGSATVEEGHIDNTIVIRIKKDIFM